MAQSKSYPKTTSEGGFVYGSDQGMPYITGAGQAGLSVQHILKTLSGASEVINFESEGLKDMANASYGVIVQGETATRTTVDESTKTATGFTVIGGANTEVVSILIIGTLADQSA